MIFCAWVKLQNEQQALPPINETAMNPSVKP